MDDNLTTSIEVALTPAQAFAGFANALNAWWPREYTWSNEVLQDISMNPKAGGALTEIGPHGFRCDFGRVLEAVPGEMLRFTWQIGPHREPVPDAEKASQVLVEFEPAATDGHTRVTLTHSGFARHGEGSEAYRDAMASPHGWPFILEAYARMASGYEETM